MRAVVIGAGRVGCASVGHLLAAAGHEVVLVNRDARVVERINRHGGYVVRVAEDGRVRCETVGGVRALGVGERSRVVDAISRADLVATAVGAAQLPAVAALVAAGLRRSRTPCNVVAFENAVDPGAALRRLVARCRARVPAPRRGAGEATRTFGGHGFAGGVVLRIVADRRLDPDPTVPLTFLADGERRLIVDNRGLVAPLPDAPGLTGTDSYPAWVRGKLFTLNAAHAAAAYLGHLKGYRYIHSAVRDEEIRHVVGEVVALGRGGAAAMGGPAEPLPDPAGILRRLGNAALRDTVVRVARDPLRKVGPTERLVGAAVHAAEAGLRPDALALVIAAALRYARALGHTRATVERLVHDVCALDPTVGTGALVLRHAGRMAVLPDRALALDLDTMSWAARGAGDAAACTSGTGVGA